MWLFLEKYIKENFKFFRDENFFCVVLKVYVKFINVIFNEEGGRRGFGVGSGDYDILFGFEIIELNYI